jgi:hypothetical protein
MFTVNLPNGKFRFCFVHQHIIKDDEETTWYRYRVTNFNQETRYVIEAPIGPRVTVTCKDGHAPKAITYCRADRITGEGDALVFEEAITPTHAVCCHLDQFTKRKGRSLALKRALDQLFPGLENRTTRRSVWNAYHEKLGETEKVAA